MSSNQRFEIPSIYLWPIKQICANKYIDVQRLFAQAGLSATEVLNNDIPIDQVAFIKVVNEGGKASGDKHFGFLIGKELTLYNSGLIGQLMAIQTCIANIYPIVNYMFNGENRGTRHLLTVKGRIATTEISYLVPEEVNCDQIVQIAIAGYMTTFRQLLGDLWKPSRVLLRQKKFATASVIEDYCRSPVTFGAEIDGFEFSTDLLYHHTVKKIGQSRSTKIELAKVLMSCDDLDRLIASYIEFNLADRAFDKASIAKNLGIHQRVLTKCLSDKGFHFKTILEDVRKEKATRLLKTTQLPVTDIASEVGYTESRTFVGAFKKWTGTTPLQWRKSQLVKAKT